jgi:hypothetical protein
VALSPTGDKVAWISAQGAVVARPLDGGPAVTLANDAVTTVVGRAPALAWNSDGTQVAYVAVGTKDMIEPRRPERGVSTEGAFPVPLPKSDTLGNVVKTVSIGGADHLGRIERSSALHDSRAPVLGQRHAGLRLRKGGACGFHAGVRWCSVHFEG